MTYKHSIDLPQKMTEIIILYLHMHLHMTLRTPSADSFQKESCRTLMHLQA